MKKIAEYTAFTALLIAAIIPYIGILVTHFAKEAYGIAKGLAEATIDKLRL